MVHTLFQVYENRLSVATLYNHTVQCGQLPGRSSCPQYSGSSQVGESSGEAGIFENESDGLGKKTSRLEELCWLII